MTGRVAAWSRPLARRSGRPGQPGRAGRPGQPGRALAGDPFAVLGLDPGGDLTDDEVRAVWRRIAAATHPDRADGGDPERFAAAAAAYTDLRTGYGRGEARAALTQARGPLLGRGLPIRLALRVIAAGGVAAAALLAAPGPAGPALATGSATWLILTAGRDLSWRARRYPGSGPVATGRAGSDDQADQEPT